MSNFSNLNQNSSINKSKTCRICGIESENGQKLFNSKSDIQRIAVQICASISIKLKNIQNYPNWICPGCHLQFDATHQFFKLIKHGQNKLSEEFGFPSKPGRKSKRAAIYASTDVDDDQLDDPSSDNLGATAVAGKRNHKIPERFKDSMQGNELENLYSQIGITKRRTIQSKTNKIETIANIEDQDGTTIGEMLSVVSQNSQKNSTRYQCDICKETFFRELAFYNHLAHHKNILYQCTECQAVFQARAMFYAHVRETDHMGLCIIETPHLDAPFGNVQVDINDELPKEQEKLVEETESNKKETKPLKKFACIKCPKSFETNLGMQRHQKTHSTRRPFQCNICLAKFKQQFVLKIHKMTHTKEYPYKCAKCSRRFAYKRSLQMHMQGIHDGLKPYSCPICKKCFGQKSHLQEHKRIHTGERPYVCLRCGSSFKTSSQCRLHQKTHVTQEDLLVYNTNVTTTQKSFECKICGKIFSQSSNMRKHLRIHTGEKPYVCHLCPQKFSDSSNYKKHKQNHAKEKNQQSNKPVSLLERNLTEASLNSDPDSDGLITATPPGPATAAASSNSFVILENYVLPSANNSLMGIMNEDVDKHDNQWNSDVAVTDIPNDENSIVQQQLQQEKLMNQLICISYQDPMNPVSSKMTYYVVNQGF